MCKRLQTTLSGANRLSLLTSQPAVNIPPVIILDILCALYFVSIDAIRINLMMNLYFVNENVDVLTADIDVD